MNTARAGRARAIRRRAPRLAATLIGLVVPVLASAAPCLGQTAVTAEIRARVERLRSGERVVLAGDTITPSQALVDAYADAGYALLWTDLGAREQLARALRDLGEDGLDPARYHARALERTGSGAGAAADADLRRTAALLDLTRDLSVGVARPALPGIGREFAAPPPPLDGETVRALVASGSVAEEIARRRPSHFVYRGLRAGLGQLRRIAAAGGWPELGAGPALQLDSADARVATLRRRLALEGYAAADSGSAALFDAPLERAVRAFQHHHGLNEDGIVGDRTRASALSSCSAGPAGTSGHPPAAAICRKCPRPARSPR